MFAAALLGLAIAAIAPSAARAESCQEPGPLGVCPAETFKFSYMDGEGPMSGCEVRAVCVDDDADIGPTPVFIVCEPLAAGFLCEAWPQGDMDYDWVLGGGIEALDEPFSGGPVRELGCLGGTGRNVVSVTVTAPNGLSDTAFTQIPCD